MSKLDEVTIRDREPANSLSIDMTSCSWPMMVSEGSPHALAMRFHWCSSRVLLVDRHDRG